MEHKDIERMFMLFYNSSVVETGQAMRPMRQESDVEKHIQSI